MEIHESTESIEVKSNFMCILIYFYSDFHFLGNMFPFWKLKARC